MDGQVPLWLAKIFGHNTSQLKKVTGSGYSKKLLTYCIDNNIKLFLLGGKPNSVATILKNTNKPENISGYCPDFSPYPFTELHNQKIKAQISAFSPDIILVGFGAGKQEYWISDHKNFLIENGVRTAIGVGGTFEMLSGEINRAPNFIHKAGFESIYRLLQEPSLFRFKRILKSFKVFRYIKKN
nr:WecB/TagA/CpsF family glycosyltransferase [Marinifaba aquimaris]